MGARGSALVGFMFYILSTQAQEAAPRYKYAPLGNLLRGTNIATLDGILIDGNYLRTSYWNPYPPPPVSETHELVPGTIARYFISSLFFLSFSFRFFVFVFVFV